MAKATTTTTTRPRRFPDRTISPNSWDGRNSTIRPSAASNARSGSGWNIGRSCDGKDNPANRAGEKSAIGTSPGIQTINDAVVDFLNETRIVMVSTVATPRRGRPVVAERAPPSSGVQTTKVTADEAGMRVDRFVEARFPGLAFSHIQRIIRKGELRVNGKRAQPKQRLEAGQAVRIPPLRLDQPRPSGRDANVRDQTREFLKSITLHEDADVLVLNKPMGLAVQGGSGTTRHLDGMLETLRDTHGQRPRLVHRLDKDTAGCLLVAKTRFGLGACQDVPLAGGAKNLLGAGRGCAQAAPGPHLDVPRQGGTGGRLVHARGASRRRGGEPRGDLLRRDRHRRASTRLALAQAGDRPHPPIARAHGAYRPSHRGRSEIFLEGELAAAGRHAEPPASPGASHRRAASARRNDRHHGATAAAHAPVVESHRLRR